MPSEKKQETIKIYSVYRNYGNDVRLGEIEVLVKGKVWVFPLNGSDKAFNFARRAPADSYATTVEGAVERFVKVCEARVKELTRAIANEQSAIAQAREIGSAPADKPVKGRE